MLTQILLSVASLASIAAAEPHPNPAGLSSHDHGSRPRFHRALSSRFRVHRHRSKRDASPTNLAAGSLTAAEGCTDFYLVPEGSYCIKVAHNHGISLQDFYAWNPEIDSECKNLWAGFSYCVGKTTSSAASSPASVDTSASKEALSTSIVIAAAPVATTTSTTTTTTTTTTTSKAEAKTTVIAKQAAVKTTTTPSSTTTAKPTTTTSAAPAATTTSVASSDDDEDDEDGECDADDEDDEDDSSSTTQQPTTTPAAVIAAAKATTTSKAPAATNVVADVTGSLSALVSSGISTSWTSGWNSGAVFSWFRTNSAQDSTNGHSWCYRTYDDSMPGIAISLKTMLSTFGGDPIKAGQAYCGLEVELQTSNGKTATGFVADAFDDRWVLTPNSADIVIGLFSQLWGSTPSSKDNVFTGASWRFTGGRNANYKFNNGNPV